MFMRILVIGIAMVFLIAVYFRIRVALKKNLKVTSWWRSPLKNFRVGGATFSQHLIGWAVDVVPVNTTTFNHLRDIGFNVVLNEGDHIHAQVL